MSIGLPRATGHAIERDTTERQYLFTGFNGFGQFGNAADIKTTQFKKLAITTTENEAAAENSCLLIASNWHFTAYAIGKELQLQGFLNGEPNKLIKLKAIANIIQIAASEKFCLVLDENGALYKAAEPNWCELESVKLEISEPESRFPQKRTILGACKSSLCENSIKITHIACGTHIAVAVSATNVVYSIPALLHQLPKNLRVRQLQCGYEHALLLSGNGDVYVWGNGLRGQLGQPSVGVEESPILLEALAGIKITHIAAGGWHSAAVSAFGDLYTWGFNVNGQLGLRVYKLNDPTIKEPSVYPLPQLQDLPKCCDKNSMQVEFSCAAKRVFTGGRHTLLMMECGSVWATGWNAHGQFGLSSKTKFYDSFKRLDVPEFNDIFCGPWCTILFCENK